MPTTSCLWFFTGGWYWFFKASPWISSSVTKPSCLRTSNVMAPSALLLPSTTFTAIPRPRFSTDTSWTASAPPLLRNAPWKKSINSVSKRPFPATKWGYLSWPLLLLMLVPYIPRAEFQEFPVLRKPMQRCKEALQKQVRRSRQYLSPLSLEASQRTLTLF